VRNEKHFGRFFDGLGADAGSWQGGTVRPTRAAVEGCRRKRNNTRAARFAGWDARRRQGFVGQADGGDGTVAPPKKSLMIREPHPNTRFASPL
jgi:hypothetical protein